MGTVSISQLQANAQSALKQMDSAYAQLGYQRVGSQYVQNPAAQASLQAAGSAAGTQSQSLNAPITPTQSAQTGLPVGTNGASLQGQVISTPLTPSSGDVSGAQSAQQIIGMANSLKSLISNSHDLSLGPLQNVTNLFRKISGNELFTSPSDVNFMDTVNYLRDELANGAFGQRLTQAVVGPNGDVGQLVPDNTLSAATNLDRVNKLISAAQATLKQTSAAYPQYPQLTNSLGTGNNIGQQLQGGGTSLQGGSTLSGGATSDPLGILGGH